MSLFLPVHYPLLKKCLESIQNQSFEDYVVWVCDGTPHNWMRYDDMQRVMEEYPEFNFVKLCSMHTNLDFLCKLVFEIFSNSASVIIKNI